MFSQVFVTPWPLVPDPFQGVSLVLSKVQQVGMGRGGTSCQDKGVPSPGELVLLRLLWLRRRTFLFQ